MKLLILSIGRDIVAGAERQLGKKADAVVRAGEVGPEEFPEIRTQVYSHLKEWQGEPIQLVLSGPLTLAFTLGQLVGLNHFDVRVLHYEAHSSSYTEVGIPERSEIGVS